MSFVSTAAKTAIAGLLLALAVDASARTVVVERSVAVRHHHAYYPHRFHPHHRAGFRHETVVIQR